MARPRLVTRTFALATTAAFAYFVAVGMSVALVSRFIEDELGGNGFHIGLATACFAAVAILARPFIARVGSRIGLARMMVGGSTIGAVGLALTGFAPSVWAVLPLRAVNGVAEATVFVGGLAIISRQAPPDRQAEAASFFSVAVFGGLTVGPLLGEVALGDDRFALAFCLAAVSCAASAAIATTVPRSIGRGEVAPRGRSLIHRAAVRPGLVLASGIAAMTGFMAFLPTKASELGMAGAGPVFATYGVLCAVIRVAGARLPARWGLPRTTTTSLVTLAGGLGIAAALDSPFGLYAAAVGIAVGLSLLYPTLMAATVGASPDSERTAALATFTAFFETGTVVGGLALGGIAALTDERGAFAGGAVAAIGGLVFVRALARDTRGRVLRSDASAPRIGVPAPTCDTL